MTDFFRANTTLFPAPPIVFVCSLLLASFASCTTSYRVLSHDFDPLSSLSLTSLYISLSSLVQEKLSFFDRDLSSHSKSHRIMSFNSIFSPLHIALTVIVADMRLDSRLAAAFRFAMVCDASRPPMLIFPQHTVRRLTKDLNDWFNYGIQEFKHLRSSQIILIFSLLINDLLCAGCTLIIHIRKEHALLDHICVVWTVNCGWKIVFLLGLYSI